MADQMARLFPLPYHAGEDQEDDHWNLCKEDDGAPVDHAVMRDVQEHIQQVLMAQNAMMQMIQQGMQQQQAQARPMQQDHRQ